MPKKSDFASVKPVTLVYRDSIYASLTVYDKIYDRNTVLGLKLAKTCKTITLTVHSGYLPPD